MPRSHIYTHAIAVIHLGVPPPTCISRSIQPTTTKTNTQQAEKLLEKLKEVGAKVELV